MYVFLVRGDESDSNILQLHSSVLKRWVVPPEIEILTDSQNIVLNYFWTIDSNFKLRIVYLVPINLLSSLKGSNMNIHLSCPQMS